MSAQKFFRAVRKAFNLGSTEAYENLELLIERETQQGVTDYRLFSYLVPGAVMLFGVLSVAGAVATKSVYSVPGAIAAALGTLAALGLAGWTHMLFQKLHRSVPVHRARIREVAALLKHRLEELQSLVGVQPALAPEVATILDAGARIYLKHAGREAEDDQTRKAREALEAAMAKLMELGKPESPAEQQIELGRGWALPLLDEMAAADRALDFHDRNRQIDRELADNDPLANLRATCIELQETDSARNELDQHS